MNTIIVWRWLERHMEIASFTLALIVAICGLRGWWIRRRSDAVSEQGVAQAHALSQLAHQGRMHSRYQARVETEEKQWREWATKISMDAEIALTRLHSAASRASVPGAEGYDRGDWLLSRIGQRVMGAMPKDRCFGDPLVSPSVNDVLSLHLCLESSIEPWLTSTLKEEVRQFYRTIADADEAHRYAREGVEQLSAAVASKAGALIALEEALRRIESDGNGCALELSTNAHLVCRIKTLRRWSETLRRAADVIATASSSSIEGLQERSVFRLNQVILFYLATKLLQNAAFD